MISTSMILFPELLWADIFDSINYIRFSWFILLVEDYTRMWNIYRIGVYLTWQQLFLRHISLIGEKAWEKNKKESFNNFNFNNSVLTLSYFEKSPSWTEQLLHTLLTIYPSNRGLYGDVEYLGIRLGHIRLDKPNWIWRTMNLFHR